MSIENIIQNLEQKIAMAPPIGAVVKFDCGESGFLIIDGKQNPAQILREDQEADLTLSAAPEIFIGMMNGTQDPTMAFMMGKLKVQGPMGLALKLNSILED